MIKVVYIISTLERCGPVNVLFDTLKHLNREKFHPSIVTLSPEKEVSRIGEFRDLDIKVESLNLTRYKVFLKGVSILKNLVRTINPDIVQANCFRSMLLSKFPEWQMEKNCCSSQYPYGGLPITVWSTYWEYNGKVFNKFFQKSLMR